MIGQYIQCRDWLEQEQAKFDERCKPVRERMQLLEGAVTEALLAVHPNGDGKVNISVPGVGTAFRKSWLSARVSDRGMFFNFVFDGRRSDFLTAACSKEAVKTYLEEHNQENPPGISVERGWETQFRKS